MGSLRCSASSRGPKTRWTARSARPRAPFFDIRRLDIIHHEVQQAIEPQAVGVRHLRGRCCAGAARARGPGPGPDPERDVGRGAAAARGRGDAGSDRARDRAGRRGRRGRRGLLAATSTAAVSPLAPVGPVRTFDPARGFEADPLVVAGGGGVLAILLLGFLAAWPGGPPIRGRARWLAGRRPPPRRPPRSACRLPPLWGSGWRGTRIPQAEGSGAVHAARVGGRGAGCGGGRSVRVQPERAGNRDGTGGIRPC